MQNPKGLLSFSINQSTERRRCLAIHIVNDCFLSFFLSSFFIFLVSNRDFIKKRKAPPGTPEVYKRNHLSSRSKKNKKIMIANTKVETKAAI